MKGRILITAISLLLVVLVVACAAPAPTPTPSPAPAPAPAPSPSPAPATTIPFTRLRYAATNTSSANYPRQVTIAEVISRNPLLEVSVSSVGGSTQTMGGVDQGLYDLGQGNILNLYTGHNAIMAFEGKPNFLNCRLIWAKSPLAAANIVSEEIKTWKDLNGKKLGVLRGTNFELWRQILEANFIDVEMVPMWETEVVIEQLKKKQVYGFVGQAGGLDTPASNVLEILNAVKGSHIIATPKEMLDKTNKKYPGQHFAMIVKGGTYPGMPDDWPTRGHPGVDVASKDVPADVMFEAAKTLFENRDYIHEQVIATPYFLQPEIILDFNVGRQVPIHAGYIRFLEEIVGVSVPEAYYPPEMGGPLPPALSQYGR